ncbi:hypothetical protein V501_00529 [Pseudogymnoascus sp. VKM F-4519 (FW-2642)]|nr:hypothetical protein V501_00529 [Pseudogymnoascus sp. VKM F-4519 (FW-2642)]
MQAQSASKEDRTLSAIEAIKQGYIQNVKSAAETVVWKLKQSLVRSTIKRRTEIKAKFSRKYDYKRAKCEDPKIIQEWFSLVRNTVAKYGILEQDIYNFNKAGFTMGVIATTKVVTSSEVKSRPKTIQLGNREWVSIIQGVNSYGWALLPFSSEDYTARK